MEAELVRLKAEIELIKSALEDPTLGEGTASTYARISGYYRDVKAWNVGKAEEYSNRVSYVL